MEINYTFNHLDFLKCLNNFRGLNYVAQDRDGTWTGFKHRPVIDLFLQCWIINPKLKTPTTSTMLYDPFDGYPLNLNWNKELHKVTPEFIEQIKNVIPRGDAYNSLLIGKYILFCDGTFGIIDKTSRGSTFIKSFNNVYPINRNGETVSVLNGWNYNRTGIIGDEGYIDYYPHGYIINKYRIAKIIL